MTEVFPCFFLSCKANARVNLAKTVHGPHFPKLLCCSMYCLFCVVLCIVSLSVCINQRSLFIFVYQCLSQNGKWANSGNLKTYPSKIWEHWTENYFHLVNILHLPWDWYTYTQVHHQTRN